MLGRERRPTPVSFEQVANNDSRARVLLLSDDGQLRVLLRELLLAHRYVVVAEDCKRQQLFRESLTDYDLVIVDLTGAPSDADRLLRLSREESGVASIAIADSLGRFGRAAADVAFEKPFDPRELLLVIRGLLADRSPASPDGQERFSVGPLTLEALVNLATVDSREIELTGVEARILAELMKSPGQTVRRDRLMRVGLGRKWSPLDRCLDTHINRLRKKIGKDARGRTPVRTVRGLGYLLLLDWEPADPNASRLA